MTDWIRPLGNTGLTVSAVTFGTSGLGEYPPEVAGPLVEAVIGSDIRTIDTSNAYSGGLSERVLGDELARIGGLPDDGLIITKVDPADGDYSGARVRASLEESRERLRMDYLPLVHLHDPQDPYSFDDLAGPGGAVEELVKAKERGEIGAIGVAGAPLATARRFVELGVFDALLVHNRLTLVDRSADALIDEAVEREMSVFNAAVYGGGILAAPRAGIETYGYRRIRPELAAAVATMADIAEEYGTTLATAALQASIRDPRVTSTVVGMGSAARVNATIEAARTALPDALFERLAAHQLPPGLRMDGV